MGWDDLEYEQEEAYERLYEEHSKRALEDFKYDRLQSFYLASPLVAKPAIESLREARRLLPVSSTAAMILPTAASEVAVKTVVLQPIVSGLVHSPALAGLVTDMVIKHQGIDRFRDLLFAILHEHGGIDLTTYARPGSPTTLYKEIRDNQVIRNDAVHKATPVGAPVAEAAIAIAASILEDVFPAILKSLGLHLHDGERVCGQSHPDEELAKLVAKLGIELPKAT
jgi:hypothetical protein